jgi:hypothetical protein
MDKKLVGAMLVPLMVMLVAGFGFAEFTAPAYIYTTVSTGAVSVEWLVDSNGALMMHPFLTPSNVSISGYRGPNYVYEATITVYNFYPGAKGILGLALKNTGSLPVKIKSMRIDVTSDPANLRSVLYYGIPGVNVGTSLNTWASNWNQEVYFKNTLNAWNGYTLDYATNGVPQAIITPGNWFAAYAYLEMDYNAGNAFQGQSIQFTITLTVQQAV